jgi:alpha-soluble NSF attachment protein
MFKMAKKWQQAGSAFTAAANLHAQAGSRHDAATNYVDASNCFKKVNPMTIFLLKDFNVNFLF